MPNNMPDARAINEALRRARELHMRARAQQQEAAARGETAPPSRSAPAPQEEPRQESSPSEPSNTPPPLSAEPPPAQETASLGGVSLEALLTDKERMLLLTLLVLLAGEEQNTDLIFAIFYLLI